MLYSCTHMASVGSKGLSLKTYFKPIKSGYWYRFDCGKKKQTSESRYPDSVVVQFSIDSAKNTFHCILAVFLA